MEKAQSSSMVEATMNKKISGLSAGIGALTFGKGLVGGLLKHNQAQHNFRKAKGRARKAADRANRRIAENYKLTIGNYLADIKSTEQQWSAMIDQSLADAAFLDDYAGDVYVQRQQKLNEVFAAEAFRQQDQVVRLSNIFFDVDKFNIKLSSIVELKTVIQVLKKNPSMRIEISGHTDNTGSDTHNKELSQNRANAVVNYLVEKGIDKRRLVAVGYGASKPSTSNETVEGRARNRRIEMRILELGR